MKKITHSLSFFLLFAGILFIYGCPVGVDYSPDTPGSKPIDKRLLGTWTCVSGACDDIQVVEVTKSDNTSYSIRIIEKGSSYNTSDIAFKAWVTQIDGCDFLYAQGDSTSQYYNYTYKFNKKRLVLYDTRFLEGGMDAVTSGEALRAELSASLKKPDFFTEPQEFKRK